ncbi:uncharacterized protein LOC143795770 [Ranitomeya variabilis]|uniref:uncharacterized protein LOC143795770 n=1 Tax=Ranitomeya variabilis TaxID=490064 RepID=UPI0040570010
MEPTSHQDESPAVMEPPAAVSKKPKRMYLTCPVCYKVTDRLDKHLQEQCMKQNSAKERTDALDAARDRIHNIASKGTTMDYEEILSFGTVANIIPFLENRGFLILHKPSTARTVQVQEEQTDKAPAEECEEELEVAQESQRTEEEVPSTSILMEQQGSPDRTEEEVPSTSILMEQQGSPVGKVEGFEEVIVGSPSLTVPDMMDLH